MRGALTQMQTALNGISASTDELNTLLDASTQIQDGIAGWMRARHSWSSR